MQAPLNIKTQVRIDKDPLGDAMRQAGVSPVAAATLAAPPVTEAPKKRRGKKGKAAESVIVEAGPTHQVDAAGYVVPPEHRAAIAPQSRSYTQGATKVSVSEGGVEAIRDTRTRVVIHTQERAEGIEIADGVVLQDPIRDPLSKTRVVIHEAAQRVATTAAHVTVVEPPSAPQAPTTARQPRAPSPEPRAAQKKSSKKKGKAKKAKGRK